jgi:hypothetical protein
MPYHSPYRLLGFGIEGEVGDVFALEAKEDGRKIRDLLSFLVLQN